MTPAPPVSAARGAGLAPASAASRAFTLIELLVVMGVIALLISITMPALSHARETARRAKCLANLRSIGQGFAMYQNDHKGLFPRVNPLHGDPPPPGSPPSNDPSLLDILGVYLDAEVPRRGDDGDFIVSDPFKCPSDRGQTEHADSGKPIYATIGCSYEYVPGPMFMLLEALFVPDPQLGITRAYEKSRAWAVVVDFDPYHKGRATGPGQNAAFFSDYHADWYTPPGNAELTQFIRDAAASGGLRLPGP
jgi:prepilin-type N-terminal cleavage/methylation domain-containing protein